MSTLNELRDQCYKTAVEHGWHEKEANVGEKIALMHSELSEALEAYRDNKPLNMIYFTHVTEAHPKPDGVPVELADVIIRILDFCGRYGIDIEDAVQTKMAYNETRPYRHGGKVC